MIKRTLYFGNPAYLSLKSRQLVIKKPSANDLPPLDYDNPKEYTDAIKTIPIEDIGLIVLDCQQIILSSALLTALLDNNCAVVTCDQKHLPTGLLLTLYGNTVQTERHHQQLEASLPLKKQLWQQTIQAKIKNQAAVLKTIPEVETGNMTAWAQAVKSGDSDNLEGRAAAYYWKSIFVDNPKFTREDDDITNAMLNYGYAIIRALVARAIVGAGLMPTIGIHHHNRYDAYCLADDLMEPYRPYVDRIVLNAVNEGKLPEELDTMTKKVFLELPTKEVIIDGSRRPLMLAVSQTVNSLQKCFAGEIRKLTFPTL